MMMRNLQIFVGIVLLAGPADAHPHIFIDTQLEVKFDAAGLAEGIRITWSYDDLTSLQVIADRGMDDDFDGSLTAAETAELSGFDMDWEEGYAGDTYAQLGAAPLQLSAPADWTAGYQHDIITSSHYRSFAEPVEVTSGPLIVRVYDPSLYSGYYIVGEPKLTGTSHCTAAIQKPDLDAANKLFEEAIANLPGDVENDYPALGSAYAEEVRITCNAPS